MSGDRAALPLRTLVTLSVYWLGILTIQFGLGNRDRAQRWSRTSSARRMPEPGWQW